ncbi:MAG TPA: SAM-dependent methyltransferase, partial [Polyangiaceae bacterium]|nr:SAM-dependent methyltransferase [Polyangiaceae bacterium]
VQSQTGIPYALIDGRFANTAAALKLAGDMVGRQARAAELIDYVDRTFSGTDQLLARVPAARSLRRMKSRLSLGRVRAQAEEGTLLGVEPPNKDGASRRELANPELFSPRSLPNDEHAAAAATFLSFEQYMDAALHDVRFGYYARGVQIGKAGHFDTHPEEHSPDYGRWLAAWAFKAWTDLIAQGELSEAEPFPIVEFGAGNGRLARDFLDAVSSARARWPTFAARVQYRIYEISAALRDKQRALLGQDAQIVEGDARRPAAALERDFPGGLRGLVLSNELPDAFGVHKLWLSAEGHARVALVLPRVEPALRDALDQALAQRIDAANAAARSSFTLPANAGDLYLDAATFKDVMSALAELPDERLDQVWFEEAYVAAAVVPELAQHLRANAAQYALALAAEDSGVLVYVNLHASRFIAELGASLAAGFIVTLDYGDTTWNLLHGARRGEFPFRVYGHWQDYLPRPNDPYSAPGTQDLTADVNFTDLSRAAEAAGLRVVHFGPERDVCGDFLPELLRACAEREALQKLIGNPLFKVLVLGRRTSDAFHSALASPLALAAQERDVPKARRHAIAAIERALAAT